MLRDTESRPKACDKYWVPTSCGVSAINAGAAMVSATDSRNVPANSVVTPRFPVTSRTLNATAIAKAALWVTAISFLRSTMSANAPAWRARTKPGTAQLVCTKPTRVGESVSEVIAQPAATMCMKVPTFDTRAAIHNDRYIAMRNGDHGPPVTFAETSPLIAPTLRLCKCYRIDIFAKSRAQMLQFRVIHHSVTIVIYGRICGQRRPQNWGK